MKKPSIITQNYRMRKREEKARKHIKLTELELFKLKQLFFSTPKKLWMKGLKKK